ncbi:hypothetical protein PCIT_a3138 [Pseudoalteromonas citrea]|uniref:Uncharacterized protein n=2 Tax=Pseudoalteromonas citrea TaxID=43655 RepID=A0AAD4AI79_9GAMM|nr:hypothetical protein [Pseudoalteromonas citrea]KAF7770161.1 hypothetical protein PCIT_a3138 [Pseudoalteromonas citrea]
MLLKLQKKNIKTLSQDKTLLPVATQKIAGGISGDHVCCTEETLQANRKTVQKEAQSFASSCCTIETSY